MGIIIIIALLLGGASVAAERALPGNFLYPVKIDVNEKVVDWLAVGAHADAAWQARLAERRLEEAEKLASEGKMNADVKARIEANFKEHADRVEQRIEDFKAKSDFNAQADIASNFEVSLRAHEAILQKFSAENVDLGDVLSSLRAKVTAEAGKAEEDRADSDEKISAQSGPDVQSAAEGKMNAAQNKIDEVKKFIASMKEKLGAGAVANAEMSLQDADKIMIEGKAKLDAKAYGEAFALFQKAEQKAQESKLLIQASDDFKVNLDINSSLRAHEDDMNNDNNDNDGKMESSSSVKVDL